ncbi:MAG: TIGR03790 family protein [Synechococcales cyanobacterium CRU_2_2]|nr:TIGR03790 family protein [Synechococcales cyanobacterium CRU_2_2]
MLGLLLVVLSALGVSACDEINPDLSAALQPQDLAIVVNTNDPLSIRIGEYYRDRRRIPARNWIEIELPTHRSSVSPSEFRKIRREVERQTRVGVQAYALTWAEPYRVGCMSITAAFALGFDEKYCSEGCVATAPSPYFNQDSGAPYRDFGLRPTMAIAATSFPKARDLIERGIRSDYDRPQGTAYLLSTSDVPRNARAANYATVLAAVPDFAIEQIQADKLENKRDVMFYFTGLAQVENIRSNRFLPGAVADHLTSFGGMLTDSSQMSSLRWLEAGATGSYGTVTEPCNYTQKFPHPAVLLHHYRRGDTLIEAYWKSVAWPGQGMFIGEPLAKPFR